MYEIVAIYYLTPNYIARDEKFKLENIKTGFLDMKICALCCAHENWTECITTLSFYYLNIALKWDRGNTYSNYKNDLKDFDEICR